MINLHTNPIAPDQNQELEARIKLLEQEKSKLEAELKSREELMSNLLSYIQGTSK